MNDTTPTPSIPPIDRWWDEFWHFYNGNPDLPLGVGIWCLFYGHILLLYNPSYLHGHLPYIVTWLLVKIVNLFLKDAEISLQSIYFYPLNGVLRITQLK